MSDVVAGVVWTGTDAVKTKAAVEAEVRATGRTKYKCSVMNMLLSGGKSQALDDTVNKAVKCVFRCHPSRYDAHPPHPLSAEYSM